jgi:hypothetical protein
MNELCESQHTWPFEMRGGGGETKRWPLLFKKDFEPYLTEIYRKNFRMTFFANFAQPFKLEDFCENVLRKNQIFTAGQVSK